MTVLFDQLPENARAWVYTANRLLTEQEVETVEHRLSEFTSTWSSHGTPLNAASKVFDRAVVVIAVQDGWDAASGCSIDKSVGILKSLEQELKVTFFDRMLLLFKARKESEISFVLVSTLKRGLQEGEISADALVVNTQADTLNTLKNGPWVAIQSTWLAKSAVLNIR